MYEQNKQMIKDTQFMAGEVMTGLLIISELNLNINSVVANADASVL